LRSPSQTDSVTPRSFQDPCQTGIFKGRLSEGGGVFFFLPLPHSKTRPPSNSSLPQLPHTSWSREEARREAFASPCRASAPGHDPRAVPYLLSAPGPPPQRAAAVGRSVGRSVGRISSAGPLPSRHRGRKGLGLPPYSCLLLWIEFSQSSSVNQYFCHLGPSWGFQWSGPHPWVAFFFHYNHIWQNHCTGAKVKASTG